MATYSGLTPVKSSVLKVKGLLGAFNLVGAFSVIVKTDGWFAALIMYAGCALVLGWSSPDIRV